MQPFCGEMLGTKSQPASRRKCPPEFTSHVVAACLCQSKAELEPEVERVRKNPGDDIFVVDYTLGQDRNALARYKGLLQRMLIANPSGIMHTNVLKAGIRSWDTENLCKKPPSKIRMETYHLMHMVQTIKAIKKNAKDGSRLPTFIKTLIDLLDDRAAPPAATNDSDSEDTRPEQDHLPQSVAQEQARLGMMKRLRQSGSARRILRRKSSPSDFDESLADIVAPRMAEPVEAGDPHVDDPTDAADEKGSIVWYADAQRAAMKQCSDGKLMRTDEWTDHRGFRRYHFADKTWLQTEVPSLQADEDQPVIKRPAAARMKPAASTGKSNMWKLIYSRTHHSAIREYTDKCKAAGKKKKPEDQKAFVQKAILKARQEFQKRRDSL